MRETALFFLFLLICLSVAALLTVPLVQTGWLDYPAHRIMGRLAQALILVGLWPFLRWQGVGSRSALGYGAPRAIIARSIAAGWLLGVAIMVPLVGALLALAVREPDLARWSEIAETALRALASGLVIGILEETFFRGALYAAIRRRGTWLAAAGWSALLYALLHVMKPGPVPAAETFDWLASGQMFLQVFSRVLDWSHLDSLAALFLVGIFLALVRERTGHVGWCIGLHAGWVFTIKLTHSLSDGNADAGMAFLVGDYDGVIGWLAAAWIGALTIALWRLRPPARSH